MSKENKILEEIVCKVIKYDEKSILF